MNECKEEQTIQDQNQASWEWNLKTGSITLSPSCRQLIGCSQEKQKLDLRFFKEVIHPDDRHAFFEAIRNRNDKPKERSTIVFRIQPQKGSLRWLKCTSNLIEYGSNGNAPVIRGYLTDITENWQSANQLFKLNRSLLAISKCNQALLHASEQSELLRDICDTITEVGGYRMAWVGFAENDGARNVIPMACSGFTDGYLNAVHIRWDESEYGQSPAGRAIRTGLPYICRNIATDPGFGIWKDEALKRGYASILAMPLKDEDSVFGTLAIYSVTTDAFDIEEKTLLSSLADNLAYGITMLRNRKAREAAEEALRQSEARYRSLFHNHHTVMLMIDPGNGSIIDANPAAELFYGWTKDQLCSMTIDRINAQPCGSMQTEMQRKVSLPNNVLALRHHLADGSFRDVDVTSGPISVDGKSLFYLIVNDVTESRQFEKIAAENNKRMHYIMASTNTGLWETGITDNTTSWSDEIWDLYGLERGSCVPSFENWMQTVIPEDRELMQQAAEKAVADLSEFIGTWRVRKPDGSIRWLMAKGSPFIQPDGSIDRYVGIVIDITERKQEAEAKEQLHAQLRQAQRLETIGTLAGGIAHDFNNILTPILGYSELGLMTIPDEDPTYEYFEEIAHAADRAKTLVAQILTFSKSRESNAIPVSFRAVLEEALKLLRPLIPSTITIEHHLESSCHNVFADPSQLHQVIINLCTNAFQAMEGRMGTLSIELSEITVDEKLQVTLPGLDTGTFVRLSITDTGTGMDEKTMEHIFEPFFTTKGPKSGTGLGLSVVHGIVTSCKGTITVDSHPGKGSKFTVYLPVIDQQAICYIEHAPLPKGNNSILYIDDEEGNTRIMYKMLSRIGFRVECLTSPIKAIELFSENPEKFDLAISDQTMPGMTGTDLADRIHEIRPRLPIILITGNENSIGDTCLDNHGISKLLKKPVKITQLVAAINEVLSAART